MDETIKLLKYIAENLRKMEHSEISARMSKQEKIEFVNSVTALQQHSDHIIRNTVWRAA